MRKTTQEAGIGRKEARGVKVSHGGQDEQKGGLIIEPRGGRSSRPIGRKGAADPKGTLCKIGLVCFFPVICPHMLGVFCKVYFTKKFVNPFLAKNKINS